MTLVIPDQGEEALIDLILSVGYTLRLFKNDVTDGLSAAQIEALTEADFTEADFTGYSAKALTGGSWVVASGDPCAGEYALQGFTASADQSAQIVYGYYVTLTAGGGELRWFEEFSAPVTVQSNGDTIRVTPRITLADSQD